MDDFNTTLLQIHNSSRKQISNETSELCDTTDQMDLIQCSRIYIFLSSPWNFLQKDHTLGTKVSLNKYKKIEITSCILTDHNRKKLEINIKVE
jgi:hypothetical protein